MRSTSTVCCGVDLQGRIRGRGGLTRSIVRTGLLNLLLGLLYLFFMNKIRQAIVKRDRIADRGLICCGDPCCDNYWCWPCLTCFFIRHELNRSGETYDDCCGPSWSRGGGRAHVV